MADKHNNQIELHSEAELVLKGENNRIFIGENVKNLLNLSKIRIECGNNNTIYIGNGVTYGNDCRIKCGDGCTVFIGEDSMLSNEVKLICRHKNIMVGKHVWFGLRTAALEGTVIGDGAILGACAVANAEYPNNCIIVGNPARIVRKNAAWHRSRDERDINAIFEEYRQMTNEQKQIKAAAEQSAKSVIFH